MKKTVFVLAGVSSGVGKTTVSLGLMAAFKKRGLTVQPFKAGPDYIDPSHHSLICQRPSYNLDTWMMGAHGVQSTFGNAIEGADVAIVEGVMGLFDGKDGKGNEGSTAHLAKTLNLGVILVLDASKMAGSVAAIVLGFEKFDPALKVAGVMFNKVGSERHFIMLKNAVESNCQTKVLGYLPRDKDLEIPERHLGLLTACENETNKNIFEKLAGFIEKTINIENLLTEKSLKAGIVKTKETNKKEVLYSSKPLISPIIAIARDKAFCFYYPENMDILEEFGAKLVFFNTMEDKSLPSGTTGIYLGGGYPEMYAERLEANSALMNEIKGFADNGLPIYAECGGLMALGQNIIDLEGKSHKMAGVFPWTSKMLSHRKSLGYREVKILNGCPFLERGEVIRGHEFHYSEIIPGSETKRSYMFLDNKGEGSEEGYLYKNTLASYVHLHFASNPKFAEGFIFVCAKSNI